MRRWDWVGLGFVAAFAVSFGVYRSQRSAPPPPMAAAGEVQLGDEWMGLHREDQRVGLIHLNKAARDGGYRFTLETKMRLSAMGDDASIAVRVVADLDPKLALERFEFDVSAGPAKFSGEGTVAGTQVTLMLKTGGTSNTRTVDLPEPPVLRANLGPLLSRQDLSPGARFTYQVFDPLTQQNQTVEAEVIGREELVVLGKVVPTTRIRQRASGLVLEGWMNGRGEMLRQELGLGLVAVRETEEEARWGLRSQGEAADLMQATMMAAPGLPPSLQEAKSLRVRFAGEAAPDVLATAQDARQRVEGGWLVVRVEAIGTGLPLPVAGAEEDLAATALVQADHPAIQAAARAAAGDAKDTLAVARKLSAWLGANLRQRAVPGVPSALETLQNKVGDCNEHAALFAAMARALGVPARIVVGVVYKDGRFGYHAWNEIPVADGWLTVDATWQQLPADPGHIRLIRGGLEAQVRLLRIIGRLKVADSKAI